MDNQKKLRIYDELTLHRVDKLLDNGCYKNFNELANVALKIGVDKLYKRIYEPNTLSGVNDEKKLMLDKLNAVIISQDEMSVNIAIVKSLLQIFYSIWVSSNSGSNLSKEEIDSGLICDMPKFLKEVEDDLIKSVRRGE